MTEEERKEALVTWTQIGQQLLGDDGPVAKGNLLGADRATPERLQRALTRLIQTFTAADIAVGMPLDEPASPHAVAAAMRLCTEAGLRGFAARAASPAATREMLLNAAIEARCDRLLLLGPDSVIDQKGLWQLMSTMERTGTAALGALGAVPGAPSEPIAFSAFVGQEGNLRRLVREDVTSTGVPFPVHHLDGAVALLLDVEQIRRLRGPRFSSRTEGLAHISADEAFAKWLETNDLEILVDPKVHTARIAQELYAWRWEPTPEEP